ncbi:MAG: hypothetical protein KF727_02170 [Microbacteriaceae bacterium]|nr:hypothetical protein [Microbacteriaceae bacterium]
MSAVLRVPVRILLLVLAVLGLLAAQAWSAGPARAAGAVVYDSIPGTPPPSYPSLGYQASQTAEFGDLVELAGTNRIASTVTVGMVSWACQSGAWNLGTCAFDNAQPTTFDHPITLNVYEEGTPGPGALLASITDTVAVPFRPAVDAANCPAATPTQWYDAGAATCQNGYYFTHTWDLTAANLTLPDRVVVSIAFNTNTWGYTPMGAPGNYDSLNVAVISTTPTTGTDVDTDTMYWAGGRAPLAFEADSGWQNPSPQFGLSLRIDATAPAAGGGGGGASGPSLANTGGTVNPLAVGIAAGVVVLGAVLARVGFRRRPAHRA